MKLTTKIKNFIKIVRTIKNWYSYLYLFQLKKTNEFIYHTRDGGNYKLNLKSDDRSIFSEIIIHNVYTPKKLRIKNNDIVFDIGAHKGVFSIYAGLKNAIVYSFEPTDRNYSCLIENINLNKRLNIIPIKKAISNKKGNLNFFVWKKESDTGKHSMYVNKLHNENVKKICVPSTTIKDFMNDNCIKKIDFLKMDCEGAEYDIIYNLDDFILLNINKISLEFHDLDNNKNNHYYLADYLRSKGFEVFQIKNYEEQFNTIMYAIKKDKKLSKEEIKKPKNFVY